MASKTPVMTDEQRPAPLKRQEPSAVSNFTGGVTGSWDKLTHFLSDVRAEMRKVVTPSQKRSGINNFRGSDRGVPLWAVLLCGGHCVQPRRGTDPAPAGSAVRLLRQDAAAASETRS